MTLHQRLSEATEGTREPKPYGGTLWDRDTAIAQIEKCDFECEGGPLANNVAWRFLKDALNVGPKYLPGQGVWFEVVAEANGVSLSQWVHFYIVGVGMSSDTERRLWTYSLSYDPPAPWHYGTVQFPAVAESKLRLDRPTTASSVGTEPRSGGVNQ